MTYFGVEFKKEYIDLPGKGPSCLFVEQTLEPSPYAFTIALNKEGMQFSGIMKAVITSEKDLQEFARLIADCWKEHKQLKPKIFKPGPSGSEYHT